MKHKMKLSFWARKSHTIRTDRHLGSWKYRVMLTSVLVSIFVSTLLPLLPSTSVSANADTMKSSKAVQKLAAYNTLMYCSSVFQTSYENTFISGFNFATVPASQGVATSDRQLNGSPNNIDASYREGSVDNNVARDFISLSGSTVDVTNFAAKGAGAYESLCSAANLKNIFGVLGANTSKPQDILCKIGYKQTGMKSITDASCKPANGKYDASLDKFEAIKTNSYCNQVGYGQSCSTTPILDFSAYKPSSLLSAAASHYVRQIFYFTGADKGGCDASDASDGSFGTGYELVTIYDYNGTSIGPYQWKKKTGCAVDAVLTDQNSQGIKDFMSALNIQIVDEATAKCEALYPVGSGLSDQIRSQTSEKVAACVAGAKNKNTSAYCTDTYKKKTSYNTAKDLQAACSAGQGVDLTGDVGDSGDGTSSDPCAIIPAGTPMSWLACSIFTAITAMTKGMQSTMTDILYTPADTLFADKSTLKNASDVFRNIGMALIVITGLIMIIAQATSLEIVDAYTIKKVLPRLGVALVGMAIAWPLLKLGVTLSNDLGFGVRDLFDKFAQTASGTGTASNVGTDIGSVITAFLGGTGVIAALGMWGAILLAVSLLISYITGLIVLFMQKLLLVLLVIVAPLAISASVLPGTEKLWKLWRSNLLKVLAMFTVIIAIIKVGDVVAAVAFASNLPLMAFGAKIATLVLTFKAPQLTGQALGGLMGMASGAAYKMAGAAKAPIDNFRKQNTKQRNQEMLAGTRFNDSHGIGRTLNTLGRGAKHATNLRTMGLNPAQWGSRMRNAMEDEAHDAASEFAQKDQAFGAIKGDDAKLHAARFTTRSQIETALASRDPGRFAGAQNARARADAANQIIRAQRATNGATFQRARVRAQAATGTGYQDEDGAFNVGMMLDDINAAYGDDRAGAERALAEMRGALTNSGQIAGQAGFGDWQAAMAARRNGADDATVQRRVIGSAIDAAPPQYAIHGKPSSARAMAAEHFARMEEIQQRLQTADSPELRVEAQRDLDTALAHAAGIFDALSSSSPQNADAYATELFGRQLGGGENAPRIRELIEHAAADRDATEFHDRRREMSMRMNSPEDNPQRPGPAPQMPPGARPTITH